MLGKPVEPSSPRGGGELKGHPLAPSSDIPWRRGGSPALRPRVPLRAGPGSTTRVCQRSKFSHLAPSSDPHDTDTLGLGSQDDVVLALRQRPCNTAGPPEGVGFRGWGRSRGARPAGGSSLPHLQAPGAQLRKTRQAKQSRSSLLLVQPGRCTRHRKCPFQSDDS